jgi:polar amino acid transport system substrate-binding protein
MKLTKKQFCGGVVAASLAMGAVMIGASGFARAADPLMDAMESKTLTVATEARFAPFEYVENDEIVGYSADIMEHVMKALPGVKLERLDLPFQGILAGLEAGKYAYVVTSLTATKERSERYWLSAPIADATYAFTKKKGESSINSADDLAGKSIGVQAGSSTLKAVEQLVVDLKAKGIEVKGITTYTDNDEAYADLAVGRIDVVANNLPNLLALAAKRPDTFETVEQTFGPKRYFVWAGRRDADSINLNRFIDAQLRALNIAGVLNELQKKWIGGAVDLPMDLPELD